MTRLSVAETNYRFSRAYNAREFPWHYTEATTEEVRGWLRNYRKWVHIASEYTLRIR